MRLISILLVTILSGIAVGQYLAAIGKLPACALQCSASLTAAAGCKVDDLRNCLCRSHTLQYAIAKCVVESCNVTAQYQSSTIVQTEICNGVPQPSRVGDAIRPSVIIAAVAFTFMALRFISRLVVARRVWWDDWAIAFAALLMLPMTIIPIYPSIHLGLGKHFYTVPPKDAVTLLKVFYSTQLLYVLAQSFAKISILLLYLRIFPSQRFRLVVKISMTLITLHGLGFFFAVLFQCLPVSSIWNRELPGKCLNQRAFIFAGAGFSIFEDFAIMFLPVFELKGLHLGRRKRVALVFMFALGSFACVTSIIRLKFLSSFGTTIDQTWDYVDVVVWSLIETYTAIICASVMCIRPLITKWLPGVFPTTSNHSDNNSNQRWVRKIGAKNRQMHGHDGSIALSGEEQKNSAFRSMDSGEIPVTIETSVAFELKQNYTSSARDMEDNETMASNERLHKTWE